jgi:hypothetical protein
MTFYSRKMRKHVGDQNLNCNRELVWKAPMNAAVMINFDGAINKEQNRGGIGIVS